MSLTENSTEAKSGRCHFRSKCPFCVYKQACPVVSGDRVIVFPCADKQSDRQTDGQPASSRNAVQPVMHLQSLKAEQPACRFILPAARLTAGATAAV